MYIIGTKTTILPTDILNAPHKGYLFIDNFYFLCQVSLGSSIL